MSSRYLPDELLEKIFSFTDDKTSQPTPWSQRTFASLALTSKRFLPLARSHLYYRPICTYSPPTWDKRLSLFSALSSGLGQLVVSLEGIVNFVIQAYSESLPEQIPFDFLGTTTTFSLYHAIVKACPCLAFVELLANSSENVPKLSQALERSQSTLKTVKFTNPRRYNDHTTESNLVKVALRLEELRGIENLILHNIYIDDPDPAEPFTPLALRSFTILASSVEAEFRHLKQFLPRDSSSLEKVSIDAGSIGQFDINWILNYLPPTIAELHLVIPPVPPPELLESLSNYEMQDAPSISPHKFSRFTALTSLSFHEFDGPSLHLLEVLALSSPSLASLDFRCCKWLRSPTTPLAHTKDSILGIVEPEDLKTHLDKFKRLKRIHLGILPTRTRETYEILEKWGVGKGLEVEWTVCTGLQGS